MLPSAEVTVKLESVAVSASVNAISLALVVVIVLPPSYALCREIASDAHFVIWLVLLSIQTKLPVAVGSPVIVRIESESVTNVISFVLLGVKLFDH